MHVNALHPLKKYLVTLEVTVKEVKLEATLILSCQHSRGNKTVCKHTLGQVYPQNIPCSFVSVASVSCCETPVAMVTTLASYPASL